MAKLYKCDKCGNAVSGTEDTAAQHISRALIICGLMYLWSIGKLGWWWMVLFLL